MEEKITSMFKEEIWVAIPKHKILKYYNNLCVDGQDIWC